MELGSETPVCSLQWSVKTDNRERCAILGPAEQTLSRPFQRAIKDLASSPVNPSQKKKSNEPVVADMSDVY